MTATSRMTAAAALEAARNSRDDSYGVLLEHGTLEIGFYAPRGNDPQEPQDQDEVYIVQSGSGIFSCRDEGAPFSAGEALFVPAGETHRFKSFTDDFAAWVIFYGPTGGEQP